MCLPRWQPSLRGAASASVFASGGGGVGGGSGSSGSGTVGWGVAERARAPTSRTSSSARRPGGCRRFRRPPPPAPELPSRGAPPGGQRSLAQYECSSSAAARVGVRARQTAPKLGAPTAPIRGPRPLAGGILRRPAYGCARSGPRFEPVGGGVPARHARAGRRTAEPPVRVRGHATTGTQSSVSTLTLLLLCPLPRYAANPPPRPSRHPPPRSGRALLAVAALFYAPQRPPRLYPRPGPSAIGPSASSSERPAAAPARRRERTPRDAGPKPRPA
jgi:hypothetical protein